MFATPPLRRDYEDPDTLKNGREPRGEPAFPRVKTAGANIACGTCCCLAMTPVVVLIVGMSVLAYLIMSIIFLR